MSGNIYWSRGPWRSRDRDGLAMRKRGARRLTAICVNGKWLAQATTGTQRYATEVMRVISDTPTARNVTLILPKDAAVPPWTTNFRVVRSRFRGMVFEQLVLLWHARGKHLYSLAGPAPVAKRNQTLVMHDAMPFRYPNTFRLPFVLWYRIMYGRGRRRHRRCPWPARRPAAGEGLRRSGPGRRGCGAAPATLRACSAPGSPHRR